jgi:hypothetical protein
METIMFDKIKRDKSVAQKMRFWKGLATIALLTGVVSDGFAMSDSIVKKMARHYKVKNPDAINYSDAVEFLNSAPFELKVAVNFAKASDANKKKFFEELFVSYSECNNAEFVNFAMKLINACSNDKKEKCYFRLIDIAKRIKANALSEEDKIIIEALYAKPKDNVGYRYSVSAYLINQGLGDDKLKNLVEDGLIAPSVIVAHAYTNIIAASDSPNAITQMKNSLIACGIDVATNDKLIQHVLDGAVAYGVKKALVADPKSSLSKIVEHLEKVCTKACHLVCVFDENNADNCLEDCLKNALKTVANYSSGIALYLASGEDAAISFSPPNKTTDFENKSGKIIKATTAAFEEKAKTWTAASGEAYDAAKARALGIIRSKYAKASNILNLLVIKMMETGSLSTMENLSDFCNALAEGSEITYESIFSRALSRLSPQLCADLAKTALNNEGFVQHVEKHFRIRAPQYFGNRDEIKTVVFGFENQRLAVQAMIRKIIMSVTTPNYKLSTNTFSYSYVLRADQIFTGIGGVPGIHGLWIQKYEDGTETGPATKLRQDQTIRLILNYSRTYGQILCPLNYYIGTCYAD